MFQRRSIALAAMALLGGCAQVQPRPPAPPPRPAAPRRRPAPGPEARLAARVRQEGWMTRFWSQLTPAQRRRVLQRMRRGDPPLATDEAEAAPAWDALGLPQRDALIFGSS